MPSDPTCNSTNADFNLVLTTGRRCFLFHNTKLSWSDASLFCQTRNTSLAKVDTQEVQDLLTTNEPGKAERIDGYWMGLTRSTWRWYTGTKVHWPIDVLWVHDDVIKWKHFPRYWPFVRGIHRSPVNSPHKGQRRGALIFSLICVWINGWENNREAGDLRRHRAHYNDVIMFCGKLGPVSI